ncbi:MAG TPA: hypothetical protein VGM33_26675 [Baekduia sp.]|jgi:hypothetical protein
MSDRLPGLDALGAEIERMARAGDGRGRVGRHRSWLRAGRRPTLVLALAGLVLVVAAAALAATTGLLTGEPVKDRGVHFRSDRGLGTVVPGSAHLTALRVPDPAGGLPWGLRTVRTTRQMGCVQVGRVLDGKLGVLGQDGAFANDGKFHELPPGVLQQTDCAPLDGAGHAFVAVSYGGLPASALGYGCTARPLPALAHVTYTPPPVCPAADERLVYYGLLGPAGRAVSYKDVGGREVRSSVSGPDGAYLVLTAPTAVHPASGMFYVMPSPGSGLVAVHYRDGSTCKIRSARAIGGAKRCPLKGYVVPPAKRYTAAEVRAPVYARVSATLARPPSLGGPKRPLLRRVTVSFRAPVPTPDSRSFYIVSMAVPRGHGHVPRCDFGMTLGPVARNVAAGALVRQDYWIKPTCRGTVRGTVTLHQQRGKPDQEPYMPTPGKGDRTVGRYSTKIP